MPLESGSLTDALTEALRKQVLEGRLEPGTKITEHWAAAEFEVARSTAKAAIDRLVREGLLRGGVHKSAVVPRLTAEDVTDLYFSREPIERLAVRHLAERSEVPKAAERHLTLMQAAVAADDAVEHAVNDIALHRELVAATGSRRLRRMHDLIIAEAQLCIAQVRRSSSVELATLTEQHTAILAAIRSGDPQGAAAALVADLHSCRETLLRDLARAT